MYSYLGIALIIVGLAHCVIGIVGLMPAVQEIIRAGMFGAVHAEQPTRMAVLWFEISGLAMVAIGVLVDWIVRQQHMYLPVSFIAVFLLMAFVLIVLFPRGGAWLFLATAIALAIGRFWHF